MVLHGFQDENPAQEITKGNRPMSDNAIFSLMRRMGIEKDEMSGHGFRAMKQTILDEILGFCPDVRRTPARPCGT